MRRRAYVFTGDAYIVQASNRAGGPFAILLLDSYQIDNQTSTKHKQTMKHSVSCLLVYEVYGSRDLGSIAMSSLMLQHGMRKDKVPMVDA